ncbi:WbqC-like protein [Marinilabilia salmonicolor]|uniref:WbqC-like protein n=2 Tax=Marinilabilia salmonicolor TaxID=989 RepID=A0A368UZY0_9BACT|nr:WbqC-like protein [Marinilabilia salmonicolor]
MNLQRKKISNRNGRKALRKSKTEKDYPMLETPLLCQACFGPVEYFAQLSKGKAIIEKHSHYTRQTYRNRYNIMAANGSLSLTIPVEKEKNRKVHDKDVKIAYHTPWQHNHWQSLVSAYNSSPFFQFYADEIEPFFTKKYSRLFDFNLDSTNLICDLLGIDVEINFTEEFVNSQSDEILDLREHIHPKKTINPILTGTSTVPYKQVFDERHGFQPNLSILDLLFNKGPEAFLVLEEMKRE